MLFFVFGSLASGKSEMLRELRRRDPQLAALEPDLPAPARTKAERQLQLQQRLAEARAEIGDRDLLYAGQSPLGELMACPIATEFEGIAPCLLDCSDQVRIRRLRSRGWKNSIPEMDVLLWAAWMRKHALDPQHDQNTLIQWGAEMAWGQWISWQKDDRRWRVTVIDNTGEEPTERAGRILAWIEAQEQSLARGELPLSRGWHG